MTTDTTAPIAVRVGTLRFERQFGVIAGIFGLLYSLQTCDAAVAGWASVAGPGGVLLIALIVLSVGLGFSAVVLPDRAPRLFGAAVAVYAAALLVWPMVLHGPVPTSPMPWLAGLWPAQALFLTMAGRRLVPPLLASAGVAGVIVLVLRGSQSTEDAVSSGLFAFVVSALLTALVAVVRRGVRRAEDAQRSALQSYGQTRLDDATEIERSRTDALVHDSVITTLLSAASARSDEDELLAGRMAANALRVLGHVTRSAERGPVVAFSSAVVDAEDELADPLSSFIVRDSGVENLVLPVPVAEALVGALLEAMRNSVRHAGVHATRTLTVSPLGPDGIRIVVHDDGAGFDPGAAITDGSGIRSAVIERLRRVDGRADIATGAGAGTTVTLSWGSVVISGTQPLEQEVAR